MCTIVGFDQQVADLTFELVEDPYHDVVDTLEGGVFGSSLGYGYGLDDAVGTASLELADPFLDSESFRHPFLEGCGGLVIMPLD